MSIMDLQQTIDSVVTLARAVDSTVENVAEKRLLVATSNEAIRATIAEVDAFIREREAANVTFSNCLSIVLMHV
jgi:hypothetical protein